MAPITDGTVQFIVTQSFGVLPGTVTAFSGTFKDGYPVNKNTGLVDKEWHLCDGTNGTPDLRNRFIYGGNGMNNGTTGGEASVTLQVANIPAHGHTASMSDSGEHTHMVTTYAGDTYSVNKSRVSCTGTEESRGSTTTTSGGRHTHSITINNTGGNQPHNNMPPYYVLSYIMKL